MKNNKENIYITSDSHFSHGNILKYSNRPFMNEKEQAVIDQYLSDRSNKDYYIEYKNLKISEDTIQRHDETLIKNWNEKVPQDGDVYHLGDFCFNIEKARSILKRLNGRIHFIRGNHDKNVSNFQYEFVWIKDYYELNIDDNEAIRGSQLIVLCHYAFRVWNKSHYGAYHCYGHSHHSLPDDPNALSMDVGVDGWNYTPLSYRDIKAFMKKKNWKPIDHHGE